MKLIQRLTAQITLSTTFAFLLSNPAFADYKGPAPSSDQKPPLKEWLDNLRDKVTKPIWGTSITGTRGGRCSEQSDLNFTAIAPSSHSDGHVGVSSNLRPSVVWYIPDEQPLEMEFVLFEIEPRDRGGVKGKLLVREKLTSQQGWMKYQIPPASELSPDKHYGWKAILYCNDRQNSYDNQIIQIAAELKVAPVSIKGLEIGNSPEERAEYWANSGFWYDAIAAVAEQDDAAAQLKRRSLLMDLVELEQGLEHEDNTLTQLQRLQDLVTQQ